MVNFEPIGFGAVHAGPRLGLPSSRPPKQRQDRIEYLFLEISFIEKYQNVKNFARTYKALVNYTPQLMVSDLSLQDQIVNCYSGLF